MTRHSLDLHREGGRQSSPCRNSSAPAALRTRQMQFARLEHDGFMGRMMMPAVIFADEDSQQDGLMTLGRHPHKLPRFYR